MPAAKWNHLGSLVGLALVLCSPTALSGQTREVSVQVEDLSGPSSPIRASGHVLFDEILLSDSVKNRYDIEIQLTNASSKTILAYEVSIQGMPDVGAGFHYLHQTDHFFRSQLQFVPGAQEVVSFSNPAWSTVPGGKQDAQVAAASYKVLFVEFADGTKFGTSHWADNLSSARQLAIQRMQELAAARDASGEQGLRSSLAVVVTRSDDPQTTRTVMAHLKETLDSEGSDAVGHEIKEFLSTAQARREVM